MTPSRIRARIVSERVAWIRDMIHAIRELPLGTFEEFLADSRNSAAAESYLRRALEAIFDLGRHILAKGFALTPAEYKQIAARLAEQGVLTAEKAQLLRELAGYRNRMVHFYGELTTRELYDICRGGVADIEALLDAVIAWMKQNPELLDRSQ